VRLLLRILAALAAAALAACACPSTSPISVADRSTFVPSVRVAADIWRYAGEPSDPHRAQAIELGLSGARGSGMQTLSAGEKPVVFGGQTFTPQQQLRQEFNFRFYEIAYRWRQFLGAGDIGYEALGDVGYADLNLTISSATQRASDNLANAGLIGSFRLLWRMRPGTSVQSRFAYFGSGSTRSIRNASRLDLYLAQAIGRNVGLRAGYASWSLRSIREADDYSSTNLSPITVRFSGPALGLELMF
jgi:hypothetical protein